VEQTGHYLLFNFRPLTFSFVSFDKMVETFVFGSC